MIFVTSARVAEMLTLPLLKPARSTSTGRSRSTLRRWKKFRRLGRKASSRAPVRVQEVTSTPCRSGVWRTIPGESCRRRLKKACDSLPATSSPAFPRACPRLASPIGRSSRCGSIQVPPESSWHPCRSTLTPAAGAGPPLRTTRRPSTSPSKTQWSRPLVTAATL